MEVRSRDGRLRCPGAAFLDDCSALPQGVLAGLRARRTPKDQTDTESDDQEQKENGKNGTALSHIEPLLGRNQIPAACLVI